MTGSSSKICKPLFQRLELLTNSSNDILSLMWFLSQNLEIDTFNSRFMVLIQEISYNCVNCQPSLQYTGKEHTMLA